MLVGIVALLLAFLGLLAMVNWFIASLSQKIGVFFNTPLDLSLQKILSFIYYPFSLLMGVPPQDIARVSALLGERTIVTELVSYQHLAEYIRNGQLTDLRSVAITTYALCGFAHIASLAIFVGGTATIAPSRAKDLARLGFRALFAATLACLMTGAVAGVFISTKANQMLKF